jgi:hypothetical protein
MPSTYRRRSSTAANDTVGILYVMDECHGVLVTHQDGSVECLESECVDLAAPRHEWRADCADVAGLCGCGERPVQRRDIAA